MPSIGEVQERYDEFLADKKKVREQVRAEYQAELDRRVLAEATAFAEYLRACAAQGVPKSDLRTATRKYSNGAEFNKLWSPPGSNLPEVEYKAGRPKKAPVAPTEAYILESDSITIVDHEALGFEEFPGIERPAFELMIFNENGDYAYGRPLVHDAETIQPWLIKNRHKLQKLVEEVTADWHD